MEPTRRHWLKSVGSASVAAAFGSQLAACGDSSHASGTSSFPAKAEHFPTLEGVYLNAASHHPMIQGGADAMRDYAAAKARGGGSVSSAEVQARFAQLINADATDICYVPSTSMGEYLVNQSLGIPESGGRIVTDALHFVGSYYMYEQFGQQGMDVVTLRADGEGQLTLAQFDAAITPGTRLVAVSHVSFVNGFEHDLKALCDLAHARGALVYVDLIQSAGAVPVDVKAAGVDFAGCGTYKWLMGDFGFAFLYVKSSLLPQLKRPWYGYLQTRNFPNPITRLYPFDPVGDPPFQSVQRDDVQGFFNGSFPARPIEAATHYALGWLLQAGVANIQAWRQPLLQAIQTELRRRGFQPMTPLGSTSPIVSFAYENASRLAARLDAAKVIITLSGNRFRISPSMYNDMNDVDTLLSAIGNP